MNKKSTQEKAKILRCLVEGNSIRSTVRITGAAKNTVVKLLVDAGKACADYQDEHFTNLQCRRLQIDEIWSFVYAKQKNVPADKYSEAGDFWTWTAICADTKLVACWAVGRRNPTVANEFLEDVSSRLASRVQLTTDGYKPYINAVSKAFGNDIDYGMLVKIYGPGEDNYKRYSPSMCLGTNKSVITGNPNKALMSTSFAERQNMTMRMGMRRFTRLTNAFSKKVENHSHAIALHFMYYNFCRRHQTIKTTPAIAAGLTDKVWTLEDVIEVIDKYQEADKSN